MTLWSKYPVFSSQTMFLLQILQKCLYSEFKSGFFLTINIQNQNLKRQL